MAGGLAAMLLWMGSVQGQRASHDAAARPDRSADVRADVVSVAGGEAAINRTAPPEAQRQRIVDERQVALSDDQVRHERLERVPGKYPNRLVVETLRKDRDLKRFVPVARTEMVADHVLVHLREGASADELDALASRFNAQVLRPLSDGHTFVVRLAAPSLDAVQEAVAFFSQAVAEVAYAEPDYIRHLAKVPDDLMYGELWGMPKVSAPEAWDVETGTSSVVVAIIDTGMDMEHPDLVANLWKNPGEIPGDGIDNDGNGFVDDVNGWDFVNGDKDPADMDGHGTHCAGTVGAVGNNANQVVGVCWSVGLMPVRAGTEQGLADADIVDSIRYAARNGAKVLSNSYGGPGFSQTMYDAIEFANQRGAVFVAAAGNDASDNDELPFYPAGYDLPNVVSVAATDQNDALADFSNYGKSSVDLAAPGVDIVSTYLDGGTKSLQGTSMACPMVAGAIALYASYQPDISPAAARQLVMESVDPIDGLEDKLVSGGRLNVQAMFANANDTDKDGMPDSWEERYGLDPNDPSDADLDGDHDFLSNLREFRNGCDPLNPDTDGDSLVDGWEVRYGFNPLSVHGALPRLQYLGVNVDGKDVRDIELRGQYAYVADGAFGLKILDLSDPENPRLAGSLATGGAACGVAVDGSLAYVADAEQGLFIVDVSSPTNPVSLGTLEGSFFQVAADGDHAYLAAGTNGLRVVDVSVPSVPVETAFFDGNGDPDFKVNDVVLAGGSVYMAIDGGLGQISTSANPSTYSVTPISDSDGDKECAALFCNGSEIYLALKDYGVLVYDLSRKLLGSVETPGSAVGVYQHEGLLYVADSTMGLQIYTAVDPASMAPYASYQNIRAYGVAVADGYAYVAGETDGIQIFRSSVDSDGDGMYDGWELKYFGSLDQAYTNDFDSDGIINWGEYLAGLCPTNADQDADTLVDGADEVQTYNTDPRVDDTDGDGLSDSYEISTNATDNVYQTSPTEADTDGDSMTDGWEIENGLNPLVDDSGLDADSDGASNLDEEQAGTDPNNADTDDDGMSDGWEIDNGLDPLADDAADDPDGDSLSNLEEFAHQTNPFKADSDDDGISDPDEIQLGTDPNNPDTDGDGMDDGWEVDHGLDPLDATGDNGADGDMDHDGLTNYEEFLNGSDPYNADTDADGFGDAWERDWQTQATNALDPVVVDDDGPYDTWENGGQPQDPQLSDPDENGSAEHPFDAIQEAVNVASNGYTILVKDGQYYGTGNRNIVLGLKELRILGESRDPAKAIVKSHGLSPVFVFDGGQTTNTVLRGLSIQSSMQGLDCSNGDCGEMHGIECRDGSSPMIRDCVVEMCRDDAIYCEFASDPVISNVTIRAIYEGDAIRAKESTPTIVDCTISNVLLGSGIHATDCDGLEVSGTSVADVQGRGIWIVNDANAKIYNCTIADCWGGVRCENSSPMIDRCTVSGNQAPDYYTQNGILWKATRNIAEEAENSDDDMKDEVNDDENGGGILLLSGSFPTIQNCVIVDNRTWASDPEYSKGNELKPYYGLGGGIFVGEDCASRTINCTIADNLAMTLGGGITTYGNFVETLRNDVFWGNACSNAWLNTDLDPAVLETPGAPHFNALHCNEGTSHFDPWYCNIQDGFGFVGDRYNFETDPAFVGGGDFHLTASSPNIDKGTCYDAPLYDRDGVPRPLDGDANTNTHHSVDIGAYEYVNPLSDTDGDGILDPDEIGAGTDPTYSDTDRDGMSDGFEAQYGLDATANDADADADGDGLSNLAESGLGTNPTLGDTDGDHFLDGAEDVAGTDPVDPRSYFYVSDIHPLEGDDGCELTFDTVAGRIYTVRYSTGLGEEWQVLRAGIPGTGAPVSVQDTVNDAQCFYRVEVSRP